MMQITCLKNGKYINTNWQKVDGVPDVFPLDVVAVRLDGDELDLLLEATSLPSITRIYGHDATEIYYYGEQAKFVVGNLAQWSIDPEEDDDEGDYDDET